jgi:hypothetical protein
MRVVKILLVKFRELCEKVLLLGKRTVPMQPPIPWVPSPVRCRQTSKNAQQRQGVVIPVNKFAWLTDGPVRGIETGLPLVIDSKIGHRLLNYDEVADELQQLKIKLSDEWTGGDGLEPLPPEEVTEVVDSEEQREYRAVHDRLCRKAHALIDRPQTGIIKRPPADDIIDNIGKVYIKSARRPKEVPAGINPFPPAAHRQACPRLPSQLTTTATVRKQMQKVFKAGCEPFRDVDCEDDFPLDGLYPPDHVPTESGTQSTESSTDDPRSILVDAKEYDIFWTKHKIPFTREEVEMLEGWRQDRTDHMKRTDCRTGRILERREESIKRTFQSRMAFEKELELTADECRKVANLGPGKRGRAHVTTWDIAARSAAADPSSLPYRKALWMKFIEQVGTYGYVTTKAQEKIVLAFRKQLLSGCYVDNDVFWQSIAALEENDYISHETMVVVECLRDDLGVDQAEVIEFLETNGYPSQFYFLGLDEIEIRDNERFGHHYLIATSRTPRRPFRNEVPGRTRKRAASSRDKR